MKTTSTEEAKMPNKVFKYELQEGTTILNLPVGAKVVSVNSQRGKVCMWVLGDFPPNIGDEDLDKACTHRFKRRKFGVYMTGQTIPCEEPIAIGTVIFDDGLFVLHVVEVV
ncbi:hypothetical protein G5Y03_001127 [Vibrio parahaemolyticus]|nr:hypothetical protein [Vibrio parahaemolyticus]